MNYIPRYFYVFIVAFSLAMSPRISVANHDQCDELYDACPPHGPGPHESGSVDLDDSDIFGLKNDPKPIFDRSPGSQGASPILRDNFTGEFVSSFEFGEQTNDYDLPPNAIDDFIDEAGGVEDSTGLPATVQSDAYGRKLLPPSSAHVRAPIPVPTQQGSPVATTPQGEYAQEVLGMLASDPVNPSNGEFYIRQMDLNFPSFGIPFSHTRIYRSRVSFEGALGHGWDFSYNRRLLLIPEPKVTNTLFDRAVANVLANDNYNQFDSSAGIIIPNLRTAAVVGELAIATDPNQSYCGHQLMLTTGDATTVTFREVGAGANNLYYETDAADMTLIGTRIGEDYEWKLITPTGNVEQYDINGLMVSRVDNNGVGLEFLWEPDSTGDDWRLNSTIDSVERTIKYQYDDQDRLIQVSESSSGPEGSPHFQASQRG